jgi:hypothetical protein
MLGLALRVKNMPLNPIARRYADQLFNNRREVLKETPSGCILLKMDQRCSSEARSLIAQTRHPLFVLMHNTSPRALLDIIAKEFSGTRIWLLTFALVKGGVYRTVVAKVHEKSLFYMGPFTQIGIDLLEMSLPSLEHFQTPETPGDGIRLLGDVAKFVPHMIRWCYAS